ncbi:hypothetical protein FH972_012797 [Carpinus fangiana]|uniref:Uncharacterized protein n=1 Tax=Carpinus fangiana TaxID=176857 RepID=A0A5N6R809_9ROSI|nr:hypothetical protein FH972_012797 [Carpinus fangiana]
MARVAVSVTVTFFLLALCHARIPLDPSENDVVLPDPAPITDLPSNEQPESEPTALFEWKPERTESTESDAKSEPLTMISFRPVNNHLRPFPLTSRRGHRCRHHRRENHIYKFKPLGSRFPDREVPYGNDMIMSHEEDSGSVPEVRGGAREMWARFGHFRPRFHREDDDGERNEHMKMRHHHHPHVEREEREREDEHEHHHGHEHHHHHHHDHEHHHEQEGGFMRSVSKFFDLF